MHAFATTEVPRFEVTAIDTPRLQLRVIAPADVPALAALRDANRDHLAPWLPLRTEDPADGSRVQLLVRAHATGALLGVIAMAPIGTEWALVYWIAREHTGQGYAREAVSALARVAFAELHARTVAIYCASANTKSAAVARGAGFVRTGVTETHEAWSLTADRMVAWDAARAAVRSVNPASIRALEGGNGLDGSLRRGGPFRIELDEVDGTVHAAVTSEIGNAGAITALECLVHNASLPLGALCVRGGALVLRHACRPWELAGEHIEAIAREADRLRAVTRSLQRAASELDYVL